MTKLHIAKLAAGLLCALLIGAVGCTSGGGDGDSGGGGGSPPPPGGGAPPPPPPGVTRPTLFIETDPNGAVHIRVEERRFDAFAPNAPQRVISNQMIGPGGTNFPIEGSQTTLVSNVDMFRMQHGLQLLGTGLLSIYDYTYVQFDGGGSVHGAAIKIGDNDRPTSAATYIQRVFADGEQAPDPTFNVSNTDFIGIEYDSGPIYVRDVTGREFGDGAIDTKSSPVYVMNATLTGGNSAIKIWEGVEIFLVNTIVNTAAGGGQATFDDNPNLQAAAGFIRYYNTLWCANADAPSASHPNCSTSPSPQLVSGEELTPQQALARITQLTSDPLPGVSPFFNTEIDRIVIEYSSNGGATWQPLQVPNTGGGGFAPIGDPRYRIPLNLANADYRFRAWYERGGAKVGETSLVIDEAGQVAP